MNKIRLLVVLLLISAFSIVQAQMTAEQPNSVTIAGTVQSVLGCEEDWALGCDVTNLSFDEDSLVWRGTFDLPAGSYEYKAALNGSWEENYGANATSDGDNIALELAEDTSVTFIYDHQTNWIADNVSFIVANVAGSFQSELGCPETMGASGDWAPTCLRSLLQDTDGDGVYTFVTNAIPVGDYEAKVALNEGWEVNYGVDGELDGANLTFSVMDEETPVAFVLDTSSNILTINTDGSLEAAGGAQQVSGGGTPVDFPVRPADLEQPDLVVIPGTIQSAVGCEGDWAPDCEVTALTYDEVTGLWSGTFDIPAGDYFYKVAINGSWDENYGINAEPGGADIPLSLTEDTSVTFYYDHFTNWIVDDVATPIITAPGSYNSELGCPDTMGASGDWAPECLATWMQDPDADGIYAFATDALPAGDYEVKVAVGMTWDENYGADGAAGGANIPFTVPEDGTKVTLAYNSSDNVLSLGIGEPAVVGRVVTVDLRRAQAYWVSADTIAWDVEVGEDLGYKLHYAADASLEVADGVIAGGESLDLIVNDAGLGEDITAKFPHLAELVALQLPADTSREMLQEILRSQLAVAAYNADGQLIGGTALQIPGVLDDLFTYDGDLGVTYDGDTPTIRVWAPTAQDVNFHLFADANAEESTVLEMDYDPATGVWSIMGEPDWTYQYYLYEVQVYAPTVQRVVTNMVTDPYAFSLSMNSDRTQIVDLYNDPTLMPEGWMDTEKPALEAPEDVTVYELHVRDFSITDESVPEELRGTFAAFAVEESNGMNHLTALSQAGLSHIHLLPIFDIATINEDASERTEPDFGELAAFPPDSDQQTAIIDPIRDQDGFNWGYDPLHYTVPEGSYSTEPTGVQRIIEFRQMVQALNDAGLRVVVDVVYNHTNAAGQSDNSVLDRIVPGYYHRLNENGNVETSTCCQNTATEHNMMLKLMVDSIETWAVAYRVDGFRVDLMGHHMLSDMVAVREMLDSLTIEADGVDGEAVYVYGEGWNFGEVADNRRGVNATQLNIGGTGIGVFNDRLRDATRGGTPFGGQQEQGFLNGLFVDPNGITPGTDTIQQARLLLFMDQIRVGLAGNLADYTFEQANGETVTGADIDYNGSPAGYTLDPQENIIYVAAHDNETLWDAIQYKAPASADVAQRVRMNNMGISLVGFSQGVPFFHAGDELLRSKSLDRDSYNSGDWFNEIDFTYQDNSWGHGLPPSSRENWDIIAPLLGNEDLQVTSEDILSATNHMQEVLQIRFSSPLFRLQTAEDVQARLSFLNTGFGQVPGVIVMALADNVEGFEQIDPNYEMIVVVFNSDVEPVTIGDDALAEMTFELHPVQVNSADEVVQTATYNGDGTFTVPARTTAVFVVPRS